MGEHINYALVSGAAPWQQTKYSGPRVVPRSTGDIFTKRDATQGVSQLEMAQLDRRHIISTALDIL